MAESTYLSQFSPNVAETRLASASVPVVNPLSMALDQAEGGLTKLAQMLRQREEEEARAWASNALSKTKLDWATRLAQMKETAQPGAVDFTPTFVKDFDEYANETLKAAPKLAQKYMREKLVEYRNTLGQSALEFEAQARVDFRTDQFSQAAQNSAKLMNVDPSQYSAVLTEQLNLIDASALPPIKKSALREKTIAQISEAATWTIMRKDPIKFLETIGVNKSGAGLKGATGIEPFDNLPFDKRIASVGQALTLQSRAEADADKRREQMRKTLEEEVLKDLYTKHSSGKMTRQDVLKARDYVGASEYRSLLKMLEGDGTQRNNHAAVRDLTMLMYTDPDAATKKAFDYHQSGLITDSTLQSTVSQSRTLARQEGPKSEYERSRRYVVDSLDPGPMVPDPAGRGRMAEAVDMFDRWAAGGKRTDDEIFKYGREVVSRFKFVDFRETVMMLPQPKYGTVRRNTADPKAMGADIKNSFDEVTRRYQSGAIKKDEYDREIEVLNRWRRTLQNNGGSN